MVERFAANNKYGAFRSASGEFVRYSDYAALKAENERRAEALSRTGAVKVKETLEAIKDAILRADPNVLTDTFWMPDDVFKGGTVVDFIDHALSALEPATPEGQKPVAWLTLCIKGARKGLCEIVEAGEKATNPEYWSDAFPVYSRPAEQAVTEAVVEAAISAAATYCWQRYKGREPLNLASPAVFTSHEHQKIEGFIREHLAALKAAMEAQE